MTNLRTKAALLCVLVLCKRLMLSINEVPAKGQQELTDASSEPRKSKYFSRWEMVGRMWWLFICFLVLHGGFSYHWRLLGGGGIGALNTCTKMPFLPQKLAAWFKDEAWQVRRKIVEEDQGKRWGQNVILHIGLSWWKSSHCLLWAWVRSHNLGNKFGWCSSEQCYFSYKTGEDWRRKSGYC